MKEKFTGWNILFSQYMRRDWKKILLWILGLGVFCGGFVPAFEEIAKGDGLVGMFETLKNPAMISMIGPTPVKNVADYTLGAMYAHEMLLFCGLFSMVISGLHVISHTRKEEDLGMAELVRSFRVGRQANSLAVLKETVVINLLLIGFITGLMIFFNIKGIDLKGSLLFASSIGMAGMFGAVLALVFAQLMATSSGATGGTLGVIGLLYIWRAATDTSYPELSIFNPMSWIYLTHPFTENNLSPLLYSFILMILLFLIANLLENFRDMGAGYLPERMGRPEAKQSLLSVRGLLFRMNRGMILSWSVGFLLMGIAYGSIYGDMGTFLSSNELIEAMFTQAGISIEDSFTQSIMSILILLTIILPIAIINKLFTEESELRLSQLYATKVSRTRVFCTAIGLALTVGLVAICLAAGSLGTAAVLSIGNTNSLNVADFFKAGYNFLPAMLFFIGIASVLLGWLPKWNKLTYIYLVYTFILNYFGNLLNLPEWFKKTAILNWIPALPVEDFNLRIFGVISILSLVLIAIGLLGYQQRDLIEGA